jgi:NADH-quinone oxidoreductase subunit E
MSDTFVFTPENKELADKIIAKYPEGRQQSAVLPLLDLAQRQNHHWLPPEAIEYVADYLGMPRIKAYEVATFYSMFNLKPVGKHMIEICTTTPCWLRGSADLVSACKQRLGISPGETTDDKQFTVVEVECLGACVNAPMIQIADDYYEDLTAESMTRIIDDLAAGRKPQPGSQTRKYPSMAEGGPTSLRKYAEAAGVKMGNS